MLTVTKAAIEPTLLPDHSQARYFTDCASVAVLLDVATLHPEKF